jgi:hypothetical protein
VTKEENFRRPVFNLPDVGMMRRLHAKDHIESILRGVCSRNIRGAQAFSEHPQCMGTSDEHSFMTRTVCRTSILFWSLESDTCVTRYTVFDKKKNNEKRSAQTTWHRCRVHVCLWNASCGDPDFRSFVDVRAVNQHTREASTWRGGCCAMRTDALTKSGLQNHWS